MQSFDVEESRTPRARSPFLSRGLPPNYDAQRMPSPISERNALPLRSPSLSQASFSEMGAHRSRETGRRPVSQVIAPTPRRPRPPSINSSTSGSPVRIMPQLSPSAWEQHQRARRRRAGSEVPTLPDGNSDSSSSRAPSRSSNISAFSLSRRHSEGVSSSLNPNYRPLSRADSVVYPSPLNRGPPNLSAAPKPKSILRNPQTPARETEELLNRLSFAADIPVPKTPARSASSMTQPPYAPAPLSNDIMYPSPLPGSSRTPLAPVQSLSGRTPLNHSIPIQGNSYGSTLGTDDIVYPPPLVGASRTPGAPMQTLPGRSPTNPTIPFPGNSFGQTIGANDPIYPPPLGSGRTPATQMQSLPGRSPMSHSMPMSMPGNSFGPQPNSPGRTPGFSSAGPFIPSPNVPMPGDAGPAAVGPNVPPQSLTDRWLGLALPPSAAPSERVLGSTGPSSKSLNTPWHPSQHNLPSGNASPNRRVSPMYSGLPPVTGPLGRPTGIGMS